MFFDGILTKLSKLWTTEAVVQETIPLALQSSQQVESQVNQPMNFQERIKKYEEMDDNSPDANVALDMLADLICQGDDVLMRGHKVIIDTADMEKKEDKKEDTVRYNVYFDAKGKSKNISEKIDEIIKRFEGRTKIKYRLRNMVRRALKYGDNFEQVLWGMVKETKELRASGFYNYPVQQVEFNIDEYGMLDAEYPYIIKSIDGKSEKKLKRNEVFRIQFGSEDENKRGKSLFTSLEKTYDRLSAMKEGMVIGRLVRSHMRYLFKIDVTGMANDKALKYIDDLKKYYTKKKITDQYGNIKYLNMPLSADEDIFFPTRKDRNDGVSTLENDPYMNNIDDVKMFQAEYRMGLRMPSSITETTGSRNATAEQDIYPIRFAKSIQNNLRLSLIELYVNELKAHGIKDSDIEDINIEMAEIDSVSTVRKYGIERTRAEIAKIHAEAGVVSNRYIMENIMLLSDAEILEQEELVEEQRVKSMESAIENAKGMAEAVPTPAPTAGGSANYKNSKVRVSTNFKNKKIGKAGNAHTTNMQAENLESESVTDGKETGTAEAEE